MVDDVDHKAAVQDLLGQLRGGLEQEQAAPESDDGPAEDQVVEEAAPETNEVADSRPQSTEADRGREPATEDEPSADDPPAQSAQEKSEQYFRRKREQKQKAKETSVAVLEERIAGLTRQLDSVLRPQTQEPKPAAAEPETNPYDREENPVEYYAWRADQADKRIAALETEKQEIRQREEQQAAAEQQRAHVRTYAQHVDNALRPAYDSVPGFYEMVEDVRRRFEIAEMARGATPEKAVENANISMLTIINNGEQKGRDVDETLWDFCMQQGLRAEWYVAQDTPPLPKNGNGQEAQAPDLEGARRASRRAPMSLNARPGNRGGQSNSLETLQNKRDKDWSKQDLGSVFSLMRENAGVRR